MSRIASRARPKRDHSRSSSVSSCSMIGAGVHATLAGCREDVAHVEQQLLAERPVAHPGAVGLERLARQRAASHHRPGRRSRAVAATPAAGD